jgi:hypothetical protein
VWNTGYILDAVDGNVEVAKRANSGITTETNTFDEYVNG